MPIVAEDGGIQLSICGGDFVNSLCSSCKLGLLLGPLQMHSCSCNQDPLFRYDHSGFYSAGFSHT